MCKTYLHCVQLKLGQFVASKSLMLREDERESMGENKHEAYCFGWMQVLVSVSDLITKYSKADRDIGIGCDLSIARLKAW